MFGVLNFPRHILSFCHILKFLSGLAVMPNMDDEGAAPGGARDQVFGMAQNATADESGQVRRTITMVSLLLASRKESLFVTLKRLMMTHLTQMIFYFYLPLVSSCAFSIDKMTK